MITSVIAEQLLGISAELDEPEINPIPDISAGSMSYAIHSSGTSKSLVAGLVVALEVIAAEKAVRWRRLSQ